MKFKGMRLVLVAVLSLMFACTTVQQQGRHAVSRHAVIYEDVSLDAVWDAARGAVEEIGFTIRMESREGEGTTFEVTLPAVS